jgi:hypothetical protein
MSWTHGAAVVYRDTADRREYLLVSAPKDPNQLVIPTGHIEKRDKRDAVAGNARLM